MRRFAIVALAATALAACQPAANQDTPSPADTVATEEPAYDPKDDLHSDEEREPYMYKRRQTREIHDVPPPRFSKFYVAATLSVRRT